MTALFPEISVNGEILPQAAIAAEAQNHAVPSGKSALAWQAGARALIIRALLLQRAGALGLNAEPQTDREGRQETSDEALIRACMEHLIAPEPVTDDMCLTVYNAQPHQFRAPDLFEASHILFAARPDDPSAREEALLKAKGVIAQVQRNARDFGRLAKEYSDCPSAADGGSLGQLGDGDTVPAFEDAMRAMAVGQISAAPVETEFGFHIIRLDECAQGEILPYETVAPAIRRGLEKQAWVMAAKRVTTDLIADAEITGLDLDRLARAERAARC